MLVLTRRIGESIYIGDNIVVTVVESRKDRIRLAIDAPRSVVVDREEIRKRRLEFGEGPAQSPLPLPSLIGECVSVQGSQDGPERTEESFSPSRIEELIHG